MKIFISKGGVKIISERIQHLHPKVIKTLGHDETPYITPLLIEVISIAKRMHVYILENTEKVEDDDLLIDTSNKEDHINTIENMLPLLIDLLRWDNRILLMWIIELMIQILNKKNTLEYFKNEEAIENILWVLTSSDEIEVKKRVLYLLIELVKEKQIVKILKDLNVLEILASQIEQVRMINIHNENEEENIDETNNIKIGFWDVLKELSSVSNDLLPEFRRLHIIGTLLDELEMSKNPFHQMSLMEILTNLCMDDQNAIQIREWGVHIIGKKLLYTSDCIDKEDPIFEGLKHNNGVNNSDFKIGLKQFIDEIQKLSLILLRFLYSVQKNRKLFRLVFTPEIFGPFIDIGNYERDKEKYRLVKKINRLPDSSKATIMANFEKISRDISSGIIENQKSVNGYNIIDIIGEGAFGIVYEVEKEGLRYAMK